MYFLPTHHIKYTSYLLLKFCILNIMCHGNFAHGKFYSITQRSYKEENMAKNKEFGTTIQNNWWLNNVS